MIEIKNVTKRFGNFTALEDISFNVDESSIYGLVGYNGAGKTTLLKSCAGIYKVDEGEILINGQNVYDNGIARQNLFFVPDEMYMPKNYNLNKLRKLYKGYYENFSDNVFYNMVEAVGLDMKKNIVSFSKGMQRQAELICAMATRPKYLLLDECFDGIDPQKRNLIKKIFIEYMAETGCSMIMSSHNLQEISDLCDRVALINGTHITMDVCVDEVSSAYKKYRIICENEIDENAFENIANKGVTIEGKFATIIVSSDVDESAFAFLNPIHIDSVNLSLEEVFLNEMEDKNYDISKIFG
jgi:ABC-2 type transport system ATP-binding protein